MNEPFVQGQKVAVALKLPFGTYPVEGTVEINTSGAARLKLDAPLMVAGKARTVFWLTGDFAQEHEVLA